MALIDIAPPNGFETNTGSFKAARNQGGRPPLEGERYPSGKLKPADKREGGPSPAQITRLFEASLRGAADPIYGSALGVLFMHRKITASELAAGIAYAKLRGRHDRAIDAPRRSSASPDYGTARSASTNRPMEADEVEAVKKRLAEAFARISAEMRGAWCVPDGRGGFRWVSPESERAQCRSAGERAVALLERVCVEDRACEGYEVERLKRLLGILVPQFGIAA